MADKKTTGKQGEELAADFMQKAGYKVLFRNYFTSRGELDIIAGKKDSLVFVEVKTRTSEKFGRAAEAVTWTKRRHIISAALVFLQQEKTAYKNFRFDVIEVYMTKDGKLKEINHIAEAFDCN